MRVLRVGKPDEWGAAGLLLALEGQNFRESCLGEVRLSAGPMSQDFLGSCAVTSRNSLIQNGATNTT
jgi:hypothetical protein